MIKEFALEPSVLATWDRCRFWLKMFGVSEGRLISEFPGKWRRLVIEAARKVAKPVEGAKIVELLNRVGDQVLLRSGRPSGDGTLPWLQRALIEHARSPFDGIIASENPKGSPQVLLEAELDAQDERIKVPRQVDVQRTAADLVACAALLLRHTCTVKWVDYKMWDPMKARWRRPLLVALNVLASQRREVVLEFHTECDDDTLRTNACTAFQEFVRRYRVPGIKLSLHLYPGDVLHDRYILTERGGISIGHGLDDNEDGGSVPIATVTLLDQELFLKKWKEYSEGECEVIHPEPVR